MVGIIDTVAKNIQGGFDAVNEFDKLTDYIYDYCELMNIGVDTLVHESGPSQIEINFKEPNILIKNELNYDNNSSFKGATSLNFLNQNIEIDFVNFFLAILLSLFLALIVKLTYLRVGRALNDKDYFSDTTN